MKSQILFVVISLVLTFSEVVTGNSPNCPSIYQRYSTRHTYCQSKNPSCNILQSGVNKKERQLVVQLHNSYRSAIANQKRESNGLPPAADMIYMEWDKELAAIAQRHSEQCIYGHDKHNQRRVHNFAVGQNIARSTISGTYVQPPQPDWKGRMEAFFAEIKDFSREMVCGSRKNPPGKIGHFTQIIWSRTFRVGCGYTMFKDGGTFFSYYVCNYGPSGNDDNKCVYERGKACSKCPINTQCTEDRKFSGLCKRINTDAPYQPIPVPTMFNCDFRKNSPDCAFAKVKGPWKILTSLSGNYLELVLQPGEKGSIVFAKKLSSSTEFMCVHIKYQKGPNFAKDAESNDAKAIFKVPAMGDWTPEFNLQSFMDELDYSINLGFWGKNIKSELVIYFAVPNYASAQYIKIASVTGFNDKCENIKY